MVAAAAIQYRVEILDAHAHLYKITLTVPAPAASQRLSLPVWIPGSYLVREFSRHLSGLTAQQGGKPVGLRQLRKNSWEAACSGRAALVLSYQVYAFDPSVRAAYLDAGRGFFNGTSLCLRVHGRERAPQRIELAGLPAHWQVATAMPALTGRPGCYEAADYDELLDHPFELGQFWRGEFQAGGVTHELVVAGALPVFDGERLLADAQRICETQIVFWHGRKGGRPPFERYVFLLNAVEDGYGGLEHRASSALIAARRDLPTLGQGEAGEGHVRVLALISHEYFHAWNVKRLRPDAFAEFDYEQENHTELLWFFEGFTSYYDELFLLRSGLIDQSRYLKLLAATVNVVQDTPGRHRHSLAAASFEAWTKYYRPDENTPNITVSYYAKGALLGLALDLALRSQARGAASLDQVMRALWHKSGGGPIAESEILAVVAELGGSARAEELRQWVHGTEDLPLPALLERFGLLWGGDKPTLARRMGLRLEGETLKLRQVLQGSPAMAAGLAAGDEILACNGWRLRRLDDALLTLQPQAPQRLDLLVVRDQRVLNLPLELPREDRHTALPVRLAPADKAPARALSLRRAWLAG